MELIGPDFRAGLRQALYRPYNPAGLSAALAFFVFLVFANQVLFQGILGGGIAALSASDFASFQTGIPRAVLLALFPASLLTVFLAWMLARRRDTDPRDVVALHFPALGVLGWFAIVAGFVVTLYGTSLLLVHLLATQETGLVEQTLVQLASDPFFFLIAAGITIGAPLAEEFVFRGQIFAALSQTRLGFSGSAVITSALWAALHVTEPKHFVAVIFLMGLVLSWLLVRFGSLWVPIICHCAWNTCSTILLYVWASLQ